MPALYEPHFNGARTKVFTTSVSKNDPLRINHLRRKKSEIAKKQRRVEKVGLALSTYLGHARISNTYWYLTGVPELMGLVGQRFERFANPWEDGNE